MTQREGRRGHARGVGRRALLLACLLVVPACSTTVPGEPQPEPAALTTSGPVPTTTAGASVPPTATSTPSSTASSAAPSSTAPSAATTSARAASRTPADLLLPPDEFPEPYEAVVLPAEAVAQAAPDLTGIHPGSKVDPAGCLPPAQDYGPARTAMAVGTDNTSRATISVEVTTAAGGLDEYRSLLEQCPRVEATQRGVTATVVTDLGSDPKPPVPGAGTLALTRSVTSGKVTGGVTQSMTTRIAQLDDVRVTVTHMSFDSTPPDTAVLDEVFRDAVVYAAGG